MNPFNIKKTVKITSKSSEKLDKLRSDNKNIKKPTTNFLFYFLVLKPVKFLYTFKIRKLHYEKNNYVHQRARVPSSLPAYFNSARPKAEVTVIRITLKENEEPALQ